MVHGEECIVVDAPGRGIRRSERVSGAGRPSAGFVKACERSGVPMVDRERLWRLFEKAPTHADDAARLKGLLRDHALWRQYLRSREGDERAAKVFQAYWTRYIAIFCAGRWRSDQVEELTARFFERVFRLVRTDFNWRSPFSAYLKTV